MKAHFLRPQQSYQNDFNKGIVKSSLNQLIQLLMELKRSFIQTPNDPNSGLNNAIILRKIAIIGYCYPVLMKLIETVLQTIIPQDGYFSIAKFNILSLLETLNILCKIKGFYLPLLKISDTPKNIFEQPQSQYKLALWYNCLPSLSKNKFYPYLQSQFQVLNKKSIVQVRDFLNKIIRLKQLVQQNKYQIVQAQPSKSQFHKNNKINQLLIPHQFDIQAVNNNNLIIVDYIPDDYQTETIQLWIDRTVQLNSILGNFVCKERFGQFQYVKGPLMYAMQKGITLVMNNFQEISHQLLTSLKSLALQFRISHNQKIVQARSGFKVIGVLGSSYNAGSAIRTYFNRNIKFNSKKLNQLQHIPKVNLPVRNFNSIIGPILQKMQNKVNIQYLTNLFENAAKLLGLISLRKLLKRIERLRLNLVQLREDIPQQQKHEKLWDSYYTQNFKESVQIQVLDLCQFIQNYNKYIEFSTHIEKRYINYVSQYKKITIGRAQIQIPSSLPSNLPKIVPTQYSLQILQKISICNQLNQAPLLISQTGCGKTTLVQYLAQLQSHKLYVYNMSSGSDVMDLVGGFKPIDCKLLIKQLTLKYIQLFRQIPTDKDNSKFLQTLLKLNEQGKYEKLIDSVLNSLSRIKQLLGNKENQLKSWNQLETKFKNIKMNLDKIDSNLVFTFIEGNLLKALKQGDWVLIDEVNMATNDILQKIVPLIQGKSLFLYEKGDLSVFQRNPSFRIFACMNPANDSGKKPLPVNLIQKFTVITLQEPSRSDIIMMTTELCPNLNAEQIADIFFEVKKQKTVSLRNLSRALSYINKNKDIYTFKRAVYDGLMLGFGHKKILQKYYNQAQPKPKQNHLIFHGFLLQKGNHIEEQVQIFHLTQTFIDHLKDFLRAIAGTQLPVLLQGPTSAGKTSMIRYVAAFAGHQCIRINNHEHTEIEQYIGNYFPQKSGKLVFRQGPLVQAVRNGYWLILDQLNLARTEILQCLNRLLDDNRQLFLPQQQQHIKPHKNFRIFATQNPSSYSGRKTLSKAFRNRFVSISFNDLHLQDTMAILSARIPLIKQSKEINNYVKYTLQALMNYRQRQRVFSKDAMITIRDLLKWASRQFKNKQGFMRQGFAILAQRLRTLQQKQFVEKTLLNGIKATQMNMEKQYQTIVQLQLPKAKIQQSGIYVQMNQSFRRMAALTIKAVKNKQPVLLVGQTGCGKTTLAQLLAALSQRNFYSINCHKHMQASDLLGSLRPSINSNHIFQYINGVVIDAMLQGAVLLIDEINTAEDSVLQRLNQVLENGVIGVQRGQGWQTIKARPGFCIIATMNPSGDYGKKQLSPALRNRFTQIWVEPITHPQSIVKAMKDMTQMINTKLDRRIAQLQNQNGIKLANLIYNFVKEYNCVIALKYEMQRKLLTMRDIGWICHFINNAIKDDNNENITFEQNFIKYYWSIRILAIEGMKFTLSENYDTKKVQLIEKEIVSYIHSQAPKTVKQQLINSSLPVLQILRLLQTMTFPLLIKTDLPIQMLDIKLDHMVFFSSHTDLNDLLGQYKPISQRQFQWQDRQLLKSIKEGGIVGLFDLNLAQQPVIEGVNSLFDHRRSIFVVQLNSTFSAKQPFLPIVILKDKNTQGRKGLPNSVLNRFVKLWIPDIPSSLKINYLKQKYSHIDQNLEKTILTYLQQCPNIEYAQLQLLCQLFPDNIYQSIQIFSSPLKQIIMSTIKPKLEKNISEQKYVLQHLPLIKQFKLASPSLVQKLIAIFTIFKKSKSSIFMTGKQQVRQSIVQTLAYLLKKPMKRILLSTMVDMNDLVGSYEQITVEKDQSLKTSPTIQQQLKQIIFQNNKSIAKKETVSKFLYIESNIVKAMHDGYWLIYIQVPDSMLLQKIQKGLRDIYLQNCQVIVGMEPDSNISSYKNTKFVHIQLQQYKKQSSEGIINLYTGNLTNFHQFDTQLRMQETMKWVEQDIRSSNDRDYIQIYQEILKEMNGQIINNEQKMSKIKQFCISKLPFAYKITNRNVQQPLFYELYKRINHITPTSTHRQFQYRSLIKLLFCIQNQLLSHKMGLLKKQFNQQYLYSISLKFKILYFANISNFRKQSQAVLKILYESIDEDLLQKFFKQIERMYEQLRNKVLQVCVKFNEEEFMTIIPIKDANSLVYSLFKEPQQIILLNYRLFTTLVSHNSLEKQLSDFVLSLKTSLSETFKWAYNAKIRQFPIFKELWDKFFMTHEQNSPSIDKSIGQIVKIMSNRGIIIDENEDQITLATKIIELFAPEDNLESNLEYHVQEELKMQCLNKLIKDQSTYISTFKNFIQKKYTNYQPLSYRTKKQILNQHLSMQRQLAKKCLYRSHNNLLALKDFYLDFMHLHSQIVQNHYAQPQLRRIVVYLYNRYFDRFGDILLPYLLGLCYLHYIREKDQRIKLESCSFGIIQKFLKQQPPVNVRIKRLIQSTLNVQEEDAMERSKQYSKLQKKFKREVIIDEYTQEGKEKRKLLMQEDFLDLFNRRQQQQEKTEIQINLDTVHLLMNPATGGDELTKQFIRECLTKLERLNYQQVIAILSLLDRESSNQINIYNHINTNETNQLTIQLSAVLEQVQKILKLYPGHPVSSIASLCSKVYEQPIFKTEIYKILADCQQLVTKIFQINATLPRNLYVPVQNLVSKCLRLRRIECANWKQLINVKIWRRQKADMIQFIDLARMLRALETTSKQQLIAKECFMLFDRFMSNCPIICHKNRLKILKTISVYSKGEHFKSLPRIIGFYEYISNNYLNLMEREVRVQRIKDMKEYQKLAGWSSNEYLIFKATCQKFQRKIHTVLKKYEQQLSGHIGQYHKTLLEKQIKADIQTFYSFITGIVNATPEIKNQEQDQQIHEENKSNQIEPEQAEQESKSDKNSIVQQNVYEQLVNKIFQQIHEIKQPHHTAQSRLLILRSNINELQDFIQNQLPSISLKQCDYYPQQWMFQNTETYQKVCKYFYGFWDKLCQRNQSLWQRELIETFWNLIQKIWLFSALQLPQPRKVHQNETVNLLKGLFESYQAQNKQSKCHSIFKNQLSKANKTILQYQQIKRNSFENKIKSQTISLFKLGYILSNIAVNLQKNGLCAKPEENQQNNAQQEEQIGQGLGIGQGDIHQGAQDVGEDIQFQQQVQGHKGQQQHNNPADKEEENGINMQGQFEGQMHEKEKKEEDKQNQQEGEEADQQMGSVDDEKKQQDMKNDQGQAQGKEDADVNIDGGEGQEQIVDNEQRQKQNRKAQEREQQEKEENGQEQQENERSDWDNQQGGQKINKQQKLSEQQGQQNESISGDISSQDQKGEMQQENQQKGSQGQSDMEIESEQEKQSNQLEGQDQVIGEEINEEPQQQDEKQQQKEIKKTKTKRTNLQAYGRTDINSYNPLKDDNQKLGQAQQKAGDAKGQGQFGQQGSGKPQHSISEQFVKQFMQKIKSKGDQKLMQDLNVIANDDAQESNQNKQNQQYELTDNKDQKLATNLPAFMDMEIQQQKEKQQKQQNEQKQAQAKQRNQQRKKQRQQQNKQKQQKKPKASIEEEYKNIDEQKKQFTSQKRKKQKMKQQTDTLDRNYKAKEKQKETKTQVLDSFKLISQNIKMEKIQENLDDEDKNFLIDEAQKISRTLQEQLKSVLQPVQSTQYAGDFRTGKKLNLRKIIPYIASNYRKDRIWLRRTNPTQADYHIMLLIDDTKSMSYGQVGNEALKGLLSIGMALDRLSIQNCIGAIQDSLIIRKDFKQPIIPSNLINQFKFQYQSKHSHDFSLPKSLQHCIKHLQQAQNTPDTRDLCFIISDGKMNKQYVKPWLKQANKKNITFILIIVDGIGQQSILNIRSVWFDEGGKMKTKAYLQEFPFEYFLIVKDVSELGQVLASTLMQFIMQK